MQKQVVYFSDLGRMDYQQAWDYQERLLRKNIEIKSAARELQTTSDETLSEDPATEHYLLFVEHPAVYTLGKSGNKDNILINDDELAQKGIQFFHTNRGGDITFHGEEQIVGYPILDLEKFYTDIGKYLRSLEEVIILTCADYGITAARSQGETGVWLDTNIPGRERKICAMGVRTSRWITMHGFAFNVNTDLSFFNNIIPCGIRNKEVTSLEKELGYKVDIGEVKERIKRNFERVFDVKIEIDEHRTSNIEC